MALALACLCGFLLGGVPWALVVVRLLKGQDVRKVGSGNVGATNASRAFVTKGGRIGAFLLIYLLDAAKGFVPAWFLPGWFLPADSVVSPLMAGVLCGASAVLGHVFTPFLRFRGGKGVATATGVLFALDWQATAVSLLVFFLVRWWSGQVFFGSLALGLALAGAAIGLHADVAFGERLPVTVLCLCLAALLFWTHRSNLKKHFAARAAGKP
ncbi:MAG: glycerol-3-phosphate acyltransferase [Planctomycetes bacterium]|nr:glycerol-3-phosphate acyltransferase [Planctomycetota bacterium]